MISLIVLLILLYDIIIDLIKGGIPLRELRQI